jgi:opacity protein-like surface antigen
MKKYLFAVLCAAVMTQSAFAQSSNNPLQTRINKNGIWLGAGATWSDMDDSNVNGQTFDDESFGYNLSVGYQFLNHFGVNASWYDPGEFKDKGNKIDVDGYALDFSAGYPISGRIALTGLIGYYDFSGDTNFAGSQDQDGVRLGIGFASEVGRIVFRPRFVWYDADVNLYSLELNFAWKIELGN